MSMISFFPLIFEWYVRRFRSKKNRWWYVKVKVCLHLENLWPGISIFTTQIWGHKGHCFNTIFFVLIVQNQFNNHMNIMIEVIRVSRTAEKCCKKLSHRLILFCRNKRESKAWWHSFVIWNVYDQKQSYKKKIKNSKIRNKISSSTDQISIPTCLISMKKTERTFLFRIKIIRINFEKWKT